MSAAPNKADIFGTFLRSLDQGSKADLTREVAMRPLANAVLPASTANVETDILRVLLKQAKPQDLKSMMEQSGLPPSLLGTALTKLQQSGMVERSSIRGGGTGFRLTDWGREFAAAAE